MKLLPILLVLLMLACTTPVQAGKLSRDDFDLIRPVVQDTVDELESVKQQLTELQEKLRRVADLTEEAPAKPKVARSTKKAASTPKPVGNGWRWDSQRQTWWRYATTQPLQHLQPVRPYWDQIPYRSMQSSGCSGGSCFRGGCVGGSCRRR